MNMYRVKYKTMGLIVTYDVVTTSPKKAIDQAQQLLAKEYGRHTEIYFSSVTVIAEKVTITK